jgi:hypothetical protein
MCMSKKRHLHFTSAIHYVKYGFMVGSYTACGLHFLNADSDVVGYPCVPTTKVTCKNCLRTTVVHIANQCGIVGKGYEVK